MEEKLLENSNKKRRVKISNDVVPVSEVDVASAEYQYQQLVNIGEQETNQDSEIDVSDGEILKLKDILSNFANKSKFRIKLSLSQEQIQTKNKRNETITLLEPDPGHSRTRSASFAAVESKMSLTVPESLRSNKMNVRHNSILASPMDNLKSLPENEPVTFTFNHALTGGSTKPLNTSAVIYDVPRKLSLPVGPTSVLKSPSLMQSAFVPYRRKSTSFLTNNTPLSLPSTSSQLQLPVPLHPSNTLICSICENYFNDSRVLDCLHIFCLRCLVDLEGNKNNSSHQFWRKTSLTSDSDWNFPVAEKEKTDYYSIFSRSGSTVSYADFDTRLKTASPEMKFSRIRRNLRNKSTTEESSTTTKQPSIVSFMDKPKPLICPKCGKATDIPIGGINRLPQNFLMTRKIGELSEESALDAIQKTCHLCSNSVSAPARCLSCGVNLCKLCKEAHKRQKITSNHEVIHISDFIKQSKMEYSLKQKRIYYCPTHMNNELKLFCTICRQVICNDCTILLHRGHKCLSLAKASKIYLKMMKEALEKTKPLCDYTIHSIAKLNDVSKKVNSKCDIVHNDVENYLAEYFEALEVHRRTLLSQIARERENKMEIILAQKSDLERRSAEARAATVFTEELFEECSEVEKLSFVGILLKRFDVLEKSQSCLDVKISDTLQFLPEMLAPSNKAQHNIPMYGIITTQKISAKCCTIEGIEEIMNLRVLKRAEITLISKDKDDHTICHGGATVCTELKYKDAVLRLIPTQVNDKRDGTYAISFLPDTAGLMIMTININGKPIKDSPVKLRARKLRPHTGIFHCCAFCSSKGSKLATCACDGVMEGYMGCGHGHDNHPGRRHWSCCGNILQNSECSASNAVVYQCDEAF